MSLPLGNLDFKIITLDHHHLAEALSAFVLNGDGGDKISVDDLTIVKREANGPTSFDNVADALTNGTRLFDALAYFSLPANRRPAVVHEELGEDEADPSLLEIGRSVYYCLMFILLRGHAPTKQNTAADEPTPQFLTRVMNMTEDPGVYHKNIASFDLNSISHQWVKYVTINGLSQKTQNRLALGMAGYRIPAALTIYPVRDDAVDEARTAAEAVRRFVARGVVWDCHSVTRTGAFLDAVKNFNGNCANLILEVFDNAQIDRLVELRILFERPIYNPRFENWRSWTDDTFTPFNDRIFR